MSPRRLVRFIVLLGGVTMQISAASYAADPLEAHFKYVGDAVTQINFLVAKSTNPKGNAKEIVDEACKMFTTLVKDDQFKTLYQKPSQKHQKMI